MMVEPRWAVWGTGWRAPSNWSSDARRVWVHRKITRRGLAVIAHHDRRRYLVRDSIRYLEIDLSWRYEIQRGSEAGDRYRDATQR